jgi:hypothetical protein
MSIKDGVSASVFENEKREVLDTSSADEEGIFVGAAPGATPTPAPAVIDTFHQMAPIIPAEYVAATGSSTAPQAQAEMLPVPEAPKQAEQEPTEARENILARLRAKVAAQKEAEIIPAHREINILEKQESLVEKPLPVLVERPEPEPILPPVVLPPPPFVPPVQPKPIAPPVRAPEPSPVSPLHTYSSDFADRIDERKATTFSVLAAQGDSMGTTTIRTSTSNTRPMYARVALGIAILILGIGIVGTAVYFFSRNNVVPVIVTTIPSVIPYDEAVALTDSGTGYMMALKTTAAGPLVSSNVLVTYITLASSTSLGGSAIPQGGGVLIAAMKLGAPDILLRNINASSTVGVVNAGGANQPFFIMKVDSYERTFAGMLAWENAMTNDLNTLYPQLPPLSQVLQKNIAAVVKKGVVLTPATTTSETVLAAPTNIPGFVDSVIANHDVREYRDSYGRTVIVYGYRDKDTLIITGSELAFATLIDRLNSAPVK